MPHADGPAANPFASPEAPLAVAPFGDRPDETGLLRRWERLRILYNAILGLNVALDVMLTAGRYLGDVQFQAGCVYGAVIANLCFCAGPVLNAYAHWLGLRHRGITVMIFTLGTLFAMMLFWGSLFVQRIPSF